MAELDLDISSHRNPLIRRIRGLARRDSREAEGVILVEGLRAVISAIEGNHPIETIVYAPDRLRSPLAQSTLTQAEKQGAKLITTSAEILDALSERDASQGAIAIMPRPQATLANIPQKGTPLLVVLYEPQDPGNVGTIARTSDSAGATALVVFGSRGVDVFDPRAIRASMGSLFSLPVIEAGNSPNILTSIQKQGIKLVATSDKGDSNIWDIPLRLPTAIIMGNERAGLPAEILSACDYIARIPLIGKADSLNVASAAAIFIFEAVRQRYTSD
jgi:TrmH family RNA methyltransferase